VPQMLLVVFHALFPRSKSGLNLADLLKDGVRSKVDIRPFRFCNTVSTFEPETVSDCLLFRIPYCPWRRQQRKIQRVETVGGMAATDVRNVLNDLKHAGSTRQDKGLSTVANKNSTVSRNHR